MLSLIQEGRLGPPHTPVRREDLDRVVCCLDSLKSEKCFGSELSSDTSLLGPESGLCKTATLRARSHLC